MNSRSGLIEMAGQSLFDIAIIGGGITGASLYHRLCQSGYRVLMVDKGDFACGSSQSSGMMVWGGLLYLRRLDLASVWRFSRARDGLLDDFPGLATPAAFRYLPPPAGPWKYAVLSALYAYWLLGWKHRHSPKLERRYAEQALLRLEKLSPSLRYEEGLLKDSDSRFVLHWITQHQNLYQVPLNYCSVESGSFCSSSRRWHLQLRDQLGGKDISAGARCVVNCAGVWTDSVNQRFGIKTPYRHVLSKGVYIGIARPKTHRKPLVFEMGDHGDVLTLVPWGPISLWGPTETLVACCTEGFTVDPRDIRFLLTHAGRHLQQPVAVKDIVSVRCGVRPLAVQQSYRKQRYPLTLSRNHQIAIDKQLPWVSFYGGKLTNCMAVARALQCHIASRIGLPGSTSIRAPEPVSPAEQSIGFPGIQQPVPTPAWCKRHEFCHTLEDYLRRRTNIAQWVPREGLGKHDEHLPFLRRIALELSDQNHRSAEAALSHYRQQVERRFDRVLAHAA